MEVLLVEPGKEARIAEIGSDLKSLQAAVGGYIEAAYFFDDPVALIRYASSTGCPSLRLLSAAARATTSGSRNSGRACS